MVVRKLPAAPTTFIGRDTEIEDIINLTTSPARRLITLVGPGGIGKTRLAIEAASQVPDDSFENGVHFVDLTPVQLVDNIVPTIATAVGYQFQQSEQPDGSFGIVTGNEDQLIDYFAQKQMLLVIDNAEHLPDCVFLIERILTNAPDVTILVTSRVPLNSQWEHLYEVQGLPVNKDAIDLFTDRAVRVQPRFDVQDEIGCVTNICQLMEGMPLGLELAATWLRVLSCQELTEELMNNLSFLESRQRTVDQRHASLQAVFEQSWRLLMDTERDVLMRLSVFKGTFTRDAAQQVAGAALNTLTVLVDQSLVQITPEGRYRLHELVRQFSARELTKHPTDERDTLNAHSAYYSRFVQDQLARLKSGEMPAALRDIETNIDNVRAAWNHAIAIQDATPIQRMAESLHYYFVLRGYHQEGVDLYQAAIDAFADQDVVVTVQVYQAVFYEKLHEHDTAVKRLEVVFERVIALNDQVLLAATLMGMGHNLRTTGDVESGRQYLEQARSLYEELDDAFELGNVNRFIGYVYRETDDATTLSYFEEHYRQAKMCGNQWQLAHASLKLGNRNQGSGRLDVALDYFQQGLEYAQQFDHTEFMCECLRGMANIHFSRNNYDEANRLTGKALNLARKAGSKREIMKCLSRLGWIAYKQLQYELCTQYWEESHKIATQLGEDSALEDSFRELSIVARMKGDYEQGVEFSEQSINISQRLGNMVGVGVEYLNLSYGAFQIGRYVEGKRYGELSLAVWNELPDINRPSLLASARTNLAHNLLELGERDQALQNYGAAYDIAKSSRSNLTWELMAGVAKAMAYAGDLETAIKLLRAVLNIDVLAEHQLIVQSDYNDLIAELPEDVVQELLAEADNLTPDDAIDLMLNHPIWREQNLDQPLVDPLTERELEVLGLVAKGKSNREIAAELYLAAGTVKTHVHNIMGKLDAQNRTEAVAKAQALGIL